MISMVSIDVNWLLYGERASKQASNHSDSITSRCEPSLFQFISANTWLNDGKRQID